MHIDKKGTKLSLFADVKIVYIENTKKPKTKTPKIMSLVMSYKIYTIQLHFNK